MSRRAADIVGLETELVKLCREGLDAFLLQKKRAGSEMLLPDRTLVSLLLSTHKALCSSYPLLKDAVAPSSGAENPKELLLELEEQAALLREKIANDEMAALMQGEVDGSA